MAGTHPRPPLLDGLTLAALARELERDMVGSRVQSVTQPDRLSLAIELYRPGAGRSWLTLTARPDAEGIAFGSVRARRGLDRDAPLTLAARAHLVGKSVMAVEQPPWERILRFTLGWPGRAGGAEADTAAGTGAERPGGTGTAAESRAGRPEVAGARRESTLVLIAELMGRRANLILVTDDGAILACARTVPETTSRARPVIPGGQYRPPPSQSRLAAGEIAPDHLAGWLTNSEPSEPAWRTVVTHVAGASPLSAREAVYRACGDAAATATSVDAPALTRAVAELFDPATAVPSWAFAAERCVAYAAYELRHLDGAAAPSIVTAMERFENDALDVSTAPDDYTRVRAAAARELEAARERVVRRKGAIERSSPPAGAADDLRNRADLILAHQRDVPARSSTLDVTDMNGEPISIALDPARNAVQNAESYYTRARRAERAARGLEDRMAAASADLGYLEALDFDLEEARDRPAIDAVLAALAASGLSPHRRTRRAAVRAAPPGEPARTVSGDGFTIWVGRNSRQNELVTFGKAARGDVWLHAADAAGAHVVVKSAGRAVPESTVEEAAALAAGHSKSGREGSVRVWVVPSERVRRSPSGRSGEVTFDGGRTVVVRPTRLS